MKDRFFSFVMAMCFFFANVFAVEPPSLPQWVAPESGGVYYIYNVEADMWMSAASANSNYLGVNKNGTPILLQNFDDGSWAMKFDSNKTYYMGRGSQEYTSLYYTNWENPRAFFSIVLNEGVYNIQSHSKNTDYYNADQWLGWVGETSDYVYANRALGENTSWKFAKADEAEHYCAELALYDALKSSESYVERWGNLDYFTDYFEDIYNNRASKTVAELNDATTKLTQSLAMSNGYIAPYWNEYPIIWSQDKGDSKYMYGFNYVWDFNTNTDYKNKSGRWFYHTINSEPKSICATVSVDEPSTLVYSLSGQYGGFNVYVDGRKVRTLQEGQIYSSGLKDTRFFEVLTPGKHTITWTAFSEKKGSTSGVGNIGIMKSPLITVDLLEPGSLGTEVLYNTDHVKNVRRLKVKGEMNNDDFDKIKIMSSLLDLDLSEAIFKEIPAYQFNVTNSDTVMQFLHTLKLPEGVETINKHAFYGSLIDTLAIPSTVTTIYGHTFTGSHIKELNFSDNLTTFIGCGHSNGAWHENFENMLWLEKVRLPKGLNTIPDRAFNYCKYLTQITLPEKLKEIEDYAFYGCHRLHVQLPESLETIGNYAFWNCNAIDSLIIPKNVSSIGYDAFRDCYYLKYAEVSSPNYSLAQNVFAGCTRLETLRLNSPTVVTIPDGYPIDAGKLKQVDLIVPNFAVNNYKLDEYWYNFKSITGFDTNEVQDWVINNPLTLNHERMEGNPNIVIGANNSRLPSLKINGTNEQNINDLSFKGYHTSYKNYPGQLLSNSTKTTVNGKVQTALFITAKYWYYFSLPFDVKISDITFNNANTQFAIRYYDGAGRAENGKKGNWKNFDKENDTIPAGTGFIMQTNIDGWNYFHAMNNETKQNVVSNKEFVKTLAVNASETASDKGWNLVGNPYQCYYNTHCLNFTAPITVWNVQNKSYTAYSITDDDYALCPNEAFFVQCPNAELNTISFPTQGRQLNAVIESQNAVKSEGGLFGCARQLIDITVSSGEASDRTRIVLNDKAKLDYEMDCDASKFFSDEAETAQIYTIGADGTQYAINERPLEKGTVALGLQSNGGTYTIEMTRCQAEKVYLNDLKNNVSVCLNEESYTFNTDGGVDEKRFTISLSADATAVEMAGAEINADECEVYSTSGVKYGTSLKGLKKGIYIVNDKKVSVK